MTGRFFLRAVKALVRVTLFDSFRIRPRTEVSSLLIVQPTAKIQRPEPRVDERGTKLSEPNALNTPSLVTIGPNSGDGIAIMMSGA